MLALTCLRPLSRTSACAWAQTPFLALEPANILVPVANRPSVLTSQGQYRTAGLGSVFVTRSAPAAKSGTMSPEDVIANTPNVKLNNGVVMPLFGLGTSGINGEECTKDVHQAIQLGYRVSYAKSVF